MSEHKFNVGQTVEYSPGFNASGGKGRYTVVRQLPDAGEIPQYRIKSVRDGQERMVLENQLSRAANSAALKLFTPRRSGDR